MSEVYLYEAISMGDGAWMVKRYPDRTNLSNYTESLFRVQPPTRTDGEMIAIAVSRGSWA